MKQEYISLHDTEIIGYSFDIEKQIFDFRAKIVFPKNRWEIVKIHIDGMVGFDFQDLNSQNVICDINKKSAAVYFRNNKANLQKKYNYSLCVNLHPYDFDEIVNYLEQNNIFIFYINSSNGLNGVVFAKDMKVFSKEK